MNTYCFQIFGNAPTLYPTETLYGLLLCGNEHDVVEIPQMYPFAGEWGRTNQMSIQLKSHEQLPQKLDIVWLSIIEEKFYYIEKEMPHYETIWCQKDVESGDTIYDTFLVGMAPGGGVAVWASGEKKSVLICWYKAKEVDVPMSLFLPTMPNISVSYYCKDYKSKIFDNSVPTFNKSIAVLYNKYMQQFSYRYIIKFQKWNKDDKIWEEFLDEDNVIAEFDYIEDALYDGTYDKVHDGSLLMYHEAGKPQKLALAWHIKNSEYTAYFWFDESMICSVFDRFYGAHPDTKTDFIIHVDPIKHKYELALYRYGLKAPQIISEDVYQILVFKNKFEEYRSDNYNQASGAWVW